MFYDKILFLTRAFLLLNRTRVFLLLNRVFIMFYLKHVSSKRQVKHCLSINIYLKGLMKNVFPGFTCGLCLCVLGVFKVDVGVFILVFGDLSVPVLKLNKLVQINCCIIKQLPVKRRCLYQFFLLCFLPWLERGVVVAS